MQEWTKMPSYWVRDKDNPPLAKMKWKGDKKADQIAALMVYIILVHHANSEITNLKKELGLCTLTYTELCDLSGLSRAKISGGIKILIQLGVIAEISTGRKNIYKIDDYTCPNGWAKLPAKGLYNQNLEKIHAFHRFNLRTKHELNALKLYLLLVAFRNNSSNYAVINYDNISIYTGVHRSDIKTAQSLLVSYGLLQVDTGNSEINEFSIINKYRLTYLEPYKHRGTTLKPTIK